MAFRAKPGIASATGGLGLLALAACSVATEAPDRSGHPSPVASAPDLLLAPTEKPSAATELAPEARTTSSFPFLEGEREDASVSIGDTTHGRVANARALTESESLGILPKQRERDLRYGTEELVGLLENAGKKLHAATGARLWVGNLGKREGGDITWSVSHNAGRDADVAFCYLDAKGRPVDPPDLVPLGRAGISKDGTLALDPARTWIVVRSLLEDPASSIQFVFVAEHLKKKLLAQARATGAPPAVVERAAAILRQPAGAAPHDDHLHLRIYCSARDAAGGCVDGGLVHPFAKLHTDAREQAASDARARLADDRPEVRRRALLRLGLIGGERDVALGRERLFDASAPVRAAAASLLGALGTERDAGAILEVFVGETDPAAMASMIDAVGALGGSEAGPFLRDLVLSADSGPTFEPLGPAPLVVDAAFGEPATPLRLLGPPLARVDLHAAEPRFDRAALRALAVRASAKADRLEPVPALVALLGGGDPDLAADALESLAFITNHRVISEDDARPPAEKMPAAKAAYERLVAAMGKLPREAWLVHGFGASGFKVPSLDRRAVWELLRAVDRQAHHSYNARKVLARLLGEPAASIGWQKGEACRHFQRAIVDRRAELSLPSPTAAQRAACLAPRDDEKR
jgi:penicillin-insensitive murein endopeptidase